MMIKNLSLTLDLHNSPVSFHSHEMIQHQIDAQGTGITLFCRVKTPNH